MCEQFLNVRNTEVSYAKLPLIIDMYIYIYAYTYLYLYLFTRKCGFFSKTWKAMLEAAIVEDEARRPKE